MNRIINSVFLVFMLFFLFSSFEALAQDGEGFRGTITNNQGEPLAGVTVTVVGTERATATDEKGTFRIAASKGEKLEITSVGYKTIIHTVENTRTISLQLEPDNAGLEEVVIVGYGTQKKENLTGAISQIKMDEVLGDRPVINTTSALQGAVPGLQITRSSTPGQNSNSINIRGTLSINGGSPLILIDGAPGDIGMLNPADIESVTVLKDASSAAIYGARAAGGVILINSKRPKSGTRFQLNYNNNFGFENVINTPQQAPLTDYFKAYQEAGFSNTYWATSQNVEKWIQYYKDYQKKPSDFDIIGDGIYVDNTGTPYFLKDKELYDNFLTTGLLQTHNVSVYGGASNIRYRMSAGYNSENGPFITDKDFYKRLNVGSFVSADLNKWFTQEFDLKYGSANKRMPGDEIGALYSLRLASYYPEGNIPGSLLRGGEDLPIFTPRNIILNSQPTKLLTNNSRIHLKSILKPFKGFEGVFEYTFNKDDNQYSYYSDQWTYSTVQLDLSKVPKTDYLVKRRYFTDYNAFNVYGTYTKSFGDHNLKLMVGGAQEQSYYEYMNNRGESQAVSTVPSFNGVQGVINNTDDYSEYAIRSLFYRFNYNYKNKYLFEANGRRDGSSKFPSASRYGFFPSFSAGWQLGRENFFDFASNWLNEFKLRGSYGSIGNQNINPYQYTPSMDISKSNVWAINQDRVTIIGMPGLVSDNFTWETVTSLDFGLDIGLFQQRLTGNFDWYQRDTRDMLTQGVIQLPATIGAAAPTQNSASLRTQGVELTVGWQDKIGKLGYRINANLYNRKSWITKYENNESGLISDWYVGNEMGEIWGYKADGFYTIDDFANTSSWKLKDGVTSIKNFIVKPGDIKFKNLSDKDSENQINPGDNTLSNPGDRMIIGNTTPKYQFGANFGLNYSGFDLSIMLQGVGKRDYWLGGQSMFPFAGSGANDAVFQPIYYNQTDYWSAKSYDPGNADYMVPQNTNPKYFRIYNQMENVGSNTRVSDKFLQSASYLRVKNVTLSYTLPTKTVEKVNISSLGFFISIENLATFSSLPKGYDPELMVWNYPFYRTFSLGANLKL